MFRSCEARVVDGMTNSRDDEVTMEPTSAAKRKSSWQFRLGAVAGALLGIVATLGFLAVDLGKKPWSKDHQATNVDVGPVTRFTGEKATEVEVGNSGPILPSPLRLIVIPNTSTASGFDTFVNRDTYTGCRVLDISPGSSQKRPEKQIAATAWFFDPCHLTAYDRTGNCVSGPCTFGLFRFANTVRPDGRLIVDLRTYQPGPPR